MSLQKTQIILETAQLTSIPKAAEILGVHFVTVYRWVKDGKLNVFHIGNQTYLDIDEVKEMAKRKSAVA
ncbi:MAG: DNA-binding protein [Dehalococcoidia bacterium]|nr:MAG: DNA-binding protein [Dehalococcoidia bacterium]